MCVCVCVCVCVWCVCAGVHACVCTFFFICVCVCVFIYLWKVSSPPCPRPNILPFPVNDHSTVTDAIIQPGLKLKRLEKEPPTNLDLQYPSLKTRFSESRTPPFKFPWTPPPTPLPPRLFMLFLSLHISVSLNPSQRPPLCQDFVCAFAVECGGPSPELPP